MSENIIIFNDVIYDIVKDDLYVAGLNTELDCLRIPERIEDKKVVGLREGAFEQTSIKQVFLPKTIKLIPKNCFKNCYCLEKISIKDATTFSDSSFEGCENLKFINLPPGLWYLGDRVFYGCRSIESLHIPEFLAKVGTDAFGNTNIKTVKLDYNSIITKKESCYLFAGAKVVQLEEPLESNVDWVDLEINTIL